MKLLIDRCEADLSKPDYVVPAQTRSVDITRDVVGATFCCQNYFTSILSLKPITNHPLRVSVPVGISCVNEVASGLHKLVEDGKGCLTITSSVIGTTIGEGHGA